ncbi:MAG TPA: TQO small subunit DoxD [Caulobacteraceae bacterium]|jgi:thiosulfate dehydrogenase [quinone] large subunit
MTEIAQPLHGAVSRPKAAVSDTRGEWWNAGLALLSVRFIQGFIYWGGGSRRFIYAPSKLDPSGGHSWMANKFQTAMPGALLGMDHVIRYLLTHFYLLYAGVILFSAAELIVGGLLIVGLFTRAAALISMGFSVLLMLMFGWQGATCIDEWTMAACNLAMGATLLIGGAGAYSVDAHLAQRHPTLAGRAWFRWIAGGVPLGLSTRDFRRLGLVVFAFVAIFDVATYSYYRGSVIGPFHGGPVSPTKHHLSLSQVALQPDGRVRFHVYLDAGTPESQAHVVQASLLDASKAPIAKWDTPTLSKTPKSAFANDYAYNKFAPGPFGLRAPMGAAATITLPALAAGSETGAAYLQLTDVDGQKFTAPVKP